MAYRLNLLGTFVNKVLLEHSHTCVFVQCSCLLLQASQMAQWKESTCQCRKHKRRRFDPWVGKIPWRWKGQPIPVLLPGKFHGQRSLAGYNPQGREESDSTQQLNNNTIAAFILQWWVALRSCGRHCVLQRLKYLPSGSLHIKFADPSCRKI